MTNDFINKLRQKVDYQAAYVITGIESLGYTLEDNPNDRTIYSFKNINDDANIFINNVTNRLIFHDGLGSQ